MKTRTFTSAAGILTGVSFCLATLIPHSVQAQETGPARVNQAVEIPRVWNPDQHLYVKGNIGLADDQLRALEIWLDQNATNWTVALLESATNEQFQDAEGNRYNDMDAVEQALGKQLSNATTFGQFLHPKTQEQTGAIFILFLRERKFSYFGSDAFDKRGLGEDAWPGRLDQQAVAAMRSGGRIADAVKNTVKDVHQKLEQKIAAEIADRERRLLARQTALAQAKAGVKETEQVLANLEQAAAKFQKAHPNSSGDLARPALDQMRSQIRGAEALLEREEVVEANSALNRIRKEAVEHMRAMESHAQAASTLAQLKSQLDQLASQSGDDNSRKTIASAREHLNNAQQEHARGDSAYAKEMELARQEIRLATAHLRAAEQRAKMARLVAMGGTGGGALGLILLGLLLNVRRRPARQQAQELVELWEKALSEKTTALMELVQKRADLLGTVAEESIHRYSGKTLELSRSLVQKVDELAIMSSCANRVLQDARRLLEPRTLPHHVKNSFGKSNFLAAVRLLRDEPIRFRPDEALELVLRGTKTSRQALVGRLEDYQPFTLSFQELIDAFNARAEAALRIVDELDHGLRTAGPLAQELQQRLDHLRQNQPALQSASEKDGLFALRNLFDELLPSAQDSLAEAASILAKDPVSAVEQPLAKAGQKLEDGSAILTNTVRLREEALPKIQEQIQTLQAAQRDTEWIERSLSELNDQFEAALAQAVQGTARVEIERCQISAGQLTQRISDAVTLSEQLNYCLSRAVPEMNSTIQTARQALSKDLSLAPDKILIEPGANPDDFVGKAVKQFRSAEANLGEGQTTAASELLEAGQSLLSHAGTIVDESQKAAAAFQNETARLRQETERLAALLPEREALLKKIQKEYAATVLRLGQGDPAHPNANGSIGDNVAEAMEAISTARKDQEHSGRQFPSGAILQSAENLAQADLALHTAQHRLDEITEKWERLGRTAAANRHKLQSLTADCQQREPSVHDRRTTHKTMEEYVAIRDALQNLSNETRTVHDPFAAAEQLELLENRLLQNSQALERDRQSFAEAEKSVAQAERQLKSAVQLSEQAASDQVTDSPALQAAQQNVLHLQARLQTLQNEMQDHADWIALDIVADEIDAAAAQQAALLKGELEKAQAALSAFQRASSHVSAARSWRGDFGVLIGGSPGWGMLEQARNLLEQGNYDAAFGSSEAARREAQAAVAAAQAQVLALRRAAEERLERERRRRAAAAAASALSRSRSSFSSSSRSSFSSGSGMRRSGFSSGSGFRRSGW